MKINLFQSFEDLEFNLLEEEACWLSRKEELQREVSDAAARCKDRQDKLTHLQAQREEAVKIASLNTKQLEVQLVDLLRRIEEVTANIIQEVLKVLKKH